ncbi:MAG: lipid II flippase MurJ, partial [Aquificaceae bacterium]
MISSLIKAFKSNRAETVLEGAIRSSLLNIFARAFGYARSVAIAVLLGFSYQTDAFFMALSLIGLFLIFVDVFDSIGVPQLVRARLESQEAFKRLSGLLFTFTTLLALSITLISILLLPLVLKIPKGFGKEALALTQASYLLLIPYLFLNFYFHHFGAILRSQRRFTPYFVGELIFAFFNFGITALGLLTFKDYRVLPLSFSLAQLFATLYMVYVGRHFLHFAYYFDDTVKRLLLQFLQLLSVYGVVHLFILVDRAFASYLGEKAVSALTYGFLLASAPRGILKFEHMAITALSETKGSIEKLSFYLKKLLMLTLPIALFFFLFSPLLVKLFFGYGAFSKVDIDLTSKAFRFYSLSLPLLFFWPLIFRTFQVKERLLSLSVLSLFGVAANAFFNYLFIFELSLGVEGICLGTFLAYLILCTLGFYGLR